MWAGGKTKVLKHYEPFMPKSVQSYYEPFLGGGAMFIRVMSAYQPTRVVLNDSNPAIIAIYESIQKHYDEFIRRLNTLESQYLEKSKIDRKQFYYDVRNEHAWHYEKWSRPIEAATLYFLLKTGFNGIYQLNKNTNGRYGTPSGLLNQRHQIYERGVMRWWQDALQRVTLSSQDWSSAVCDDNDAFYFFDPPYRDSYADYGRVFSDDDLLKLIDFCDRQQRVFLCNRDDDNWFCDKAKSLKVHHFHVSYTAGRRKKTDNGHEAKRAQEILLYKTDNARTRLDENAANIVPTLDV